MDNIPQEPRVVELKEELAETQSVANQPQQSANNQFQQSAANQPSNVQPQQSTTNQPPASQPPANKPQQQNPSKMGLNLNTLADILEEPEIKPQPSVPKIRILAGVVSSDRRININTASSLQNAKDYFSKQNIEFKVVFINDKQDYMGKNRLLSWFMLLNSTHFLMVGDGFSFTPMVIEKLLSADKPLVCSACPMPSHQWSQVVEWVNANRALSYTQIPIILTNYLLNVSQSSKRKLSGDYLLADFASTDFMLFRRDCVETLIKKVKNITSCVNVTNQNVEKIYMLWEPQIVVENDQVNQIYKTPDEVFCKRLLDCEIEIIVDIKAHVTREIFGEVIIGNLDSMIHLEQKN